MKALPANSIWFKILPLVILIILVEAFFYKVLFMGHNFFWRDILSHSYPAKKILIDAINAGYYPLWNQFVSTGIPYLADLSNQPLYIFNLLFILLPANLAINATILLHYLLGALFMYLFVNLMVENKYICIFSALSFTLSGYCLSLSCNLEYLTPVIWLPAAFWAFYKFIHTSKTFYILLCAVSLAMMIFGGEPMAFYYTVGFLFVRTLFELKDKTSFIKHFVLLALVVAVSIAFSSVQLLPAVELTHLSARAAGLTFTEATTWSFNPYRMLEFIIPFFFGRNFPYPQYWGVSLQSGGFSVPWAEAVYIGAIPFVLAMFSFFINRIKEKYYWLTVLLISFILAFGCFTPIYKLLFNILPFMSSFRYPEKLILFATFALCVLAGLGLKDLIEHKFYTLGNKFLIIPGILLLISLLATFLPFDMFLNVQNMKISGLLSVVEISNNIKFGLIYFSIIVASVCFIWYWNKLKDKKSTSFILIVILITFFDALYINSRSYITTTTNLLAEINSSESYIKAGWDKKYPPRVYFSSSLSDTTGLNLNKINDIRLLNNFHPLIAAFWLNNLIPNRSIIYQINTFNTVTSLTLKNINAVSEVLMNQNLPAFVKLFNIDYVMCSKSDASKFIALSDRYIESANNVILQPENTLPRAIITSEMLNSTTIMREVGNYQPVSNEAKIVNYTNNKVVITVNNEDGGYLCLFDSYYPGWKVFVDGKSSELLKIAELYRGVKLKKGKYDVIFLFDPLIVKIGLFVTVLGFLLAVILTLKYKTIMKT